MNPDHLILIVEDSALLRAVLRDTLEHENFRVIEAPDGKEGLETALRERPSLIMLDLMMPVMGGIEMLGLLRKDTWGATTPVIILTGTKDEQIAASLKTDPHLDFLLKEDWMMDEVVSKVKKGLGLEIGGGMDTIVAHVKERLGVENTSLESKA